MTNRDAHNQAQLDYYRSAAGNPRIRPAETPYVLRHVDRMIGFAGLTADDRILDVGCGMGKFTLPLIRRGLHVEGLDLSPALLEGFRQHLRPGEEEVPLHCADVLEPPAALHGQFDVALGFFALHHFMDLTAAFRALRSLLRPGGRLAFLEPNAFNPLYYLQITFTPGMSWRSDRGIVAMRRSRLVDALQSAGFGEIRHRWTGHLPPVVANASIGPRLEDRLDALSPLRPMSAFQLIGAIRPDA